MSAWVNIVGLGEDGVENLGIRARTLIEQAEVLVGGERHLAMVEPGNQERIVWPKPFNPLIDELLKRKGKRIVVLASGDPSCHGVGTLIAERLGLSAVNIIPAPSAYTLAAARMGWPLQEVETLSVHGRAFERLHLLFQPNAKLLVLSADGSTPKRIAQALTTHGFGPSVITVLERMGARKELKTSCSADEWRDGDFADLNTVAVECIAEDDTVVKPRIPGLPDDVFEHDGQMTKREVRAITLAALAPGPKQSLWDIGAGCASISIEWMRSARDSHAFAVEPNIERAEMALRNARFLGVPELRLIRGRAPQALGDLPPPDAIFIGGGIQTDGLFDLCWRALKPSGRLVANVVSIEGEQTIYDWQQRIGGELVRIAIARATAVGRFKGWKPMMPVTQLTVTKPVDSNR